MRASKYIFSIPTIWMISMSLWTPMAFITIATLINSMKAECFKWRPAFFVDGCSQRTVLLLLSAVDDVTNACKFFFGSSSTMMRFVKGCSCIINTRSTPLTMK